MKKLALLLVSAFLVILFTVSCSKKKEEPVTPKVFALHESFELDIRNATFSGTLENASGLSELYLMLKKDTLDFERYQISYNKNKFSLTIDTLAFDSYTYHYEYVLSGTTKTTKDKSFAILVGRWSTSDGGHFEVYNADGTGKMWDPSEDVHEDEADTFDWTIDENNKMTQVVHFQGGQSDLPQYCNILTLNVNAFKYNNEGWRAEYDLIRVNQ